MSSVTFSSLIDSNNKQIAEGVHKKIEKTLNSNRGLELAQRANVVDDSMFTDSEIDEQRKVILDSLKSLHLKVSTNPSLYTSSDVAVDDIANGMMNIVEKVLQMREKKKAEKSRCHQPFPHFYIIRDANGKTRGFLIGTIHELDGKTKELLDKNIAKVLAKTDRLFLEQGVSEEAMSELRQVLQREIASQLSDDKKKELIANWLEFFKSQQRDFDAESFQKNLIKLSLTDQILLCKEKGKTFLAQAKGLAAREGSIESNDSIDSYLQHQFKQAGKKILGLESFDEGLAAIKRQFQALNSTQIEAFFSPNNLESEVDIAREWLKIWQSDRPFIAGSTSETSERSDKMGKAIAQDLLSNPNSCGFYACGMGHLYDDKNVIAYLQSQGFEILKAV